MRRHILSTRIVTRTFCNVAGITLANASASPAAADLSPSPIVADGLKGTIRDVNLRLNTLTYTYPRDVEVLLVGPGGQTAIVMGNVEGAEINGVTLRLDDEAAAPLPDAALQSGVYRPTNFYGNVIAFNAPAPSANANAALSVFDGSNPNGTWRLFVQDMLAVVDRGEFMGAGRWRSQHRSRKRSGRTNARERIATATITEHHHRLPLRKPVTFADAQSAIGAHAGTVPGTRRDPYRFNPEGGSAWQRQR